MRTENKKDIRVFVFIWLGQFVSLIGSSMTSFALGVYIFQQTGETTPIALVWAFTALPSLLIAPFAGTLVDRLNRKTVMIVSDVLAAVVTLFIAVLFLTGEIAIWHIYIGVMLNATFNLFQGLAYIATITLVVPSSFLPRANGLIEVSGAVSGVATPVIAGFLYGTIGLAGIIALDFVMFLIAVSLLLLVKVPSVIHADDMGRHFTFLSDFIEGWRFIRGRGLLFALLIFTSFINVIAVSETLVTPLVLSFSTEESLGIVLGIGGLGLLLGSLFMTLHGGPKRLVIGAVLLECMAGTATLLAGLRPSILLVTIAVFALFFTYPIIGACTQTIWQKKSPPHLQGRVFATRRMFSWAALPLTFVLAGPLVDNLLQPAMNPGGTLADSIGIIIGTGEGRGIGLMMVITGGINVLAGLIAWFFTDIRFIEERLPDMNTELNESDIEPSLDQ